MSKKTSPAAPAGTGAAAPKHVRAGSGIRKRPKARRTPPRPSLKTLAKIVRALRPFFLGKDVELFYALPLDCGLRPIGDPEDWMISKGTCDQVCALPRDVYCAAIRHRAKYLIVAHNHPSGQPLPSRPDVQMTRLLSKVGDFLEIPLLDHLVFTPAGDHESLRIRNGSAFTCANPFLLPPRMNCQHIE